MEREIILTNDGSHSISIPQMQVTYHSTHGSLQESLHVFIDAGFNFVAEAKSIIRVFEMGFGTGLNALLTYKKSIENNLQIHYTAVETYPLQKEEFTVLNYGQHLNLQSTFWQIHQSNWNEDVLLNEHFVLHKSNTSLQTFSTNEKFDLIYHDAFAPTIQTELWTIEIFQKYFSMLNENGVLVTYSSKGDVRRNLLTAGFSVQKLKGAMKKREMLRAIKLP